MPEGHLVSTNPIVSPCIMTQGQGESEGMVHVAYAKVWYTLPNARLESPAVARRDIVLYLPTDIHSFLIFNK